MTFKKKGDTNSYDAEYVRDISVTVYHKRLYDGDREVRERGEEEFRKDAKMYDSLTRDYLDAINKLGLKQRS